MKFNDKFNNLFKTLLTESISENSYPTLEELKKFFEMIKIPEDNIYLHLKENQYLEEVEGNSSWGATHGDLFQIAKIIFPGFYLVKKVDIKNIGTTEKNEQKWVLDPSSDAKNSSYLIPVIANKYTNEFLKNKGFYLARLMGEINPNGFIYTYLNGYILVPDVEKFLKTYKVDYDFDPGP